MLSPPTLITGISSGFGSDAYIILLNGAYYLLTAYTFGWLLAVADALIVCCERLGTVAASYCSI